MTFKDLKKRFTLEVAQQQCKLFGRLQGKPFWIWDIEEHRLEDFKTNGDCCFNHIVGLPVKGRREKPLFDYQKILYDALLDNEYSNIVNHAFKHKHLWVKKATGLGVTEFFLRLMAWLCLRNDDYKNTQMCIVTGPDIDIAIKLIKRMKGLFEPKLHVTFDSKETVLDLNGCIIEAYPSNHIDAYRALDNPKFILIDEGDFFRKGEQEDVRHVSERYIAKSDPYIVMVSTPNAPDGLFERIEKEPEATCIYKRLFLDYQPSSLVIGDREDYESQISYYKKMKWNWHNHMIVIPLSFNVEHKEMLGHCKMMLEKSYIAINPIFDKLITSLRTAIAEENTLDKEATSYDDILDAYQLALKNYEFT